MTGFDINQHLQQMGFGRGGGGGGEGASKEISVNEDEISKILEVAPNKIPSTVAKLSEGIPFIGWLLAMLIPTNAGEVGLLPESQGIAGKTINPGKGGLQGGVIAAGLTPIIAKGGKITDQTGGTGGGGGDGGGGGGGGGGGSQNFESFAASSGMGETFIAAGGGNHFEWRPEAMESLGFLRPSATPSMGGQGVGADMGIA